MLQFHFKGNVFHENKVGNKEHPEGAVRKAARPLCALREVVTCTSGLFSFLNSKCHACHNEFHACAHFGRETSFSSRAHDF